MRVDITWERAQARALGEEKALGHISLPHIDFRVSALQSEFQICHKAKLALVLRVSVG
jgi:hypothetical protein